MVAICADYVDARGLQPEIAGNATGKESTDDWTQELLGDWSLLDVHLGATFFQRSCPAWARTGVVEGKNMHCDQLSILAASSCCAVRACGRRLQNSPWCR